ncbi:MAG: sigma-70 family RNA polymerase sigma factor [Acidimicrobiia bacterium]|nr:sigma-70 family RNA polymerase sigma factor [Acidimicrobiia bacterium]
MGSATDRRFRALYDEHFRDVLAYCMRRVPADDAYDAANEVFAIAWQRIVDVPAGDAARPWLYVVARRVVYRRRRSHKRFQHLTERIADEQHESPPQPEAIVVRRAEYDDVLAAAARLSRIDREVLALPAWEGLSHREIAEVLGCSISAVDQRLVRAKRRLAKRYRALHGVMPTTEFAGGDAS